MTSLQDPTHKKDLFREYTNATLDYIYHYLFQQNTYLSQKALYAFGLTTFWGEKLQNPSQGKLVRSRLLLLTVDSLMGKWQTALPAACALELFHTGTLIIDDWQDKDRMRRGKKALWTIPGIGPEQAINVGIYLTILSSQVLSTLPIRTYTLSQQNDLKKIFEKAKEYVVMGQQKDIAFESVCDITLEEYFNMISLKTASLIQAGIAVGARLGKADKKMLDNLSHIATSLGQIFQMQDDYLGIFGDSDKMGKPTGDIANKKKSLPIVLALTHATGKDKDVLFDLYQKTPRHMTSQEVSKVKEILQKLDIQYQTRHMIEDMYKNTLLDLDKIPTHSFTKKKELMAIADLFAHRNA